MDKTRIPVVIAPSQITAKEGVYKAIELCSQSASQTLDKAKQISVDALVVVNILSRHGPAPASDLKKALKIEPAQLYTTSIGGNTPQYLVNKYANEIAMGNEITVLVCGAEAMRSSKELRRLKEQGLQRQEPLIKVHEDLTATPDKALGDDRPGVSNEEVAAGLLTPTQIYPLFESASAYAEGVSMQEKRLESANLFSRFTKVASTNPYAWFKEELTAQDLATPSEDNRMIVEPYTKRLCAFLGSDQAASFIITSLSKAESLGLSDQVIFPLYGADLNDIFYFSQRPTLVVSPAMQHLSKALFSQFPIEKIEYFDLYSCFPCAVKLAINAMGLSYDDSRNFTVTGGLPYFGGPGNNYVSHSIATLHEKLCSSNTYGLVTGLGWYVTKHSWGIYGSSPNSDGFIKIETSEIQEQIDTEALEVISGPFNEDVEVSVVASSVQYDSNGEVNVVSVVGDIVGSNPPKRIVASNLSDVKEFSGRNLAGEKVIITGTPPKWRLK
jgi:acetyl-CoA C-acetyltransferase